MTDSGRIVGFIEAISDRGIAGWAFRAGDAAPLRLALRIDGGAAVEVVCDRAREDVWALRTDLHAECRHGPLLGFLAEIPAECFDGQAHGFVLETADGVPAELKTAGLASEVMPEAGAVVEDDPDDGGLAFTGLPRAALFGIGAELAALRADLTGSGPEAGVYAADPERTVGSELDRAYYLGANSDVRASGADPVLHYVRQGWREGRKPAAWFDTEYYLATNPDVREAGVNPFWHYLALGRPEGRAAARAGGYRRAAIEALRGDGEGGGGGGPWALRLLPEVLARRIAAARGEGGVVLMIAAAESELAAAERGGFAALGLGCVMLAPLPGGAGRGLVRVLVNGVAAGVGSYGDIAEGLAGLDAGGGRRVFVVHGLAGHAMGPLIALRRALGATESYFWLHDFAALCPGGTLLRNDVTYCGVPAEGSNACGVCVHGENRPGHLAGLRRLFEAVEFTVVAPSEAALAVWRLAGLRHAGTVVLPPWRLLETATRVRLEAEGPIRVAFVGAATVARGWPVFRDIVERVGRFGCYRFFHLVSEEVPAAGDGRVEVIRVEGVDGVRAAVARLGIDVLAVLNPGPVAFSATALAGFAAGAEVVALADGGHAAAEVLARGRGIVAADEAALVGLFESLRLVAYVRRRAGEEVSAGEMVAGAGVAEIAGGGA